MKLWFNNSRLTYAIKTAYFGWGLGLLALGAYLAWLWLPSRLPALSLMLLVGLGVGARVGLAQPTRVRGWLQLALKPEYLALGAILIVATALRFAGLAQSLPYLDNPDEPTTVQAAIKMLQTGDLNPHFFRWPSLPFYTQFLISIPRFLAGVGAGDFTNLANISDTNFYLWGRVLSAALGSATVLVTYLIGRFLYGPATGLLAALILAVLPLHTEHSHYVTPDIMVTFWATLTILFAVLIYKYGRSRWYWWAGIAAGLTIGSKYNVGIVCLTVILAHFLTPVIRRGRFNWLVKSGLIALIIFLLTTPFAILDLSGFLDEIAFQVRHYTIVGHGTASDGASWSAYLQDFVNEAFVYQAAIVAVGGIGIVLWRQRREDWLILSLPAIGYLFFATAKVHFSRNLLPLLPPLAILGAVFVLTVVSWASQKLNITKSLTVQGVIVVILWLAFFGFALQHSFLTDRYYLQPDTRTQAGAWVIKNVAAGSKLRLEHSAPLLPPDRYQDVSAQRPIGGHDLEWYRQQGYNYLVASSYEYRHLMADDAQANQNYETLFKQGHLVAQFAGDSPDHPGPTILIYKLDP